MTEEQRKILDNEYHWQQEELGKKQVEEWQKHPMTYEESCDMLVRAKIRSGMPVEDYLINNCSYLSPFNPKPEGQAIIFIGIQASGKSTFYRTLLKSLGYGYINLDTLKNRKAEKQLFDKCLIDNKSFVVDNTNPQIMDRERYIPKAKENGFRVIGFFFQSILKDCVERNSKRCNKVPERAIPATSNKLEMPSYNEGFDELYFVKITDNGFDISNWR